MNPVLAVYAGYSLARRTVIPAPTLEPYVQDALDEIEYVTGGPDTKWGAERVKDGHPAPFKLTYVEIGNEDWLDKSGSYAGTLRPRSTRRSRQSIPTCSSSPPRRSKASSPMCRTTTTTSAPRRTSTTQPTTTRPTATDRRSLLANGPLAKAFPTPDFGAALGDAAWMTGLERNSDIIVMASYAPLLVDVDPGGMQWETDLIGYNAMKSYGSPAYYAQVLFASYLGDHTLGSKLEGAGPKLFYSITGNAAKKKLYLKLVNASTDRAADGHRPGRRKARSDCQARQPARARHAGNQFHRPTATHRACRDGPARREQPPSSHDTGLCPFR